MSLFSKILGKLGFNRPEAQAAPAPPAAPTAQAAPLRRPRPPPPRLQPRSRWSTS